MKKAQTWVFDYIIGFLMFTFLLIISIFLLRSLDGTSSYDVITREADMLSVNLLSEGFPNNWNQTTVIHPGLVTENRLDITKLEEFDTLGYERTKALLQITGEYWFYFKNSTGIINMNGKCIRGYPYEGCEAPTIPNIATDIAWTERIIILNSQIVSMKVIVWR